MSVSLRTKKLSYSIGKMNVALDLNFKSYYVNNLVKEIGENELSYLYVNSAPYGLIYNDKLYYYIKNIRGEIIKIIDDRGLEVGSYKYDPYGNILEYNGQIAKINNIRYKGYYYDKETNLYYLKSRYYDSSIGYLYQ